MNADLLEGQVCKASPAPKVHLVFPVPKVNVVSPDLRVSKATPALLVILVSLDHQVCKVWLDLRVLAVNLATRVTKVLWALLDVLENKARLDHKDLLVLLAQLVCQVSRVNLVTTVALVMPDPLGNPELLDQKDRKENKAVKVLLDLLDSLDPKVPPETVVYLDSQALLVRSVLVDYVDQPVKLDLQADPEMKDLLDLLVLLAQSDPLVHLVNPDLKARPVKKVRLVLVAALETRALLVPLAHLDRPAPLDFLDLLDNLDLPALLENVVPSVKLAQWVLKVPLDLGVNLVSKVFKVNAESVEKLELKALKVIAVSLVCKVFPALLVPKETEDRWVSLDLLANLENLDLKVLLAEMEALDLKVSWVPLVLVALLVSLVNLVLPALLVLLDLRDLPVNRWVTTLLHWPLFLDKVHPRVLILWPAMIRLACFLN